MQLCFNSFSNLFYLAYLSEPTLAYKRIKLADAASKRGEEGDGCHTMEIDRRGRKLRRGYKSAPTPPLFPNNFFFLSRSHVGNGFQFARKFRCCCFFCLFSSSSSFLRQEIGLQREIRDFSPHPFFRTRLSLSHFSRKRSDSHRLPFSAPPSFFPRRNLSNRSASFVTS